MSQFTLWLAGILLTRTPHAVCKEVVLFLELYTCSMQYIVTCSAPFSVGHLLETLYRLYTLNECACTQTDLIKLPVCEPHNLANKVHVAVKHTNMQQDYHEEGSVETSQVAGHQVLKTTETTRRTTNMIE